MPIEWCSLTERRLPRPDVVMYLSIPTDLAHKRIGADAERYECSDYLENVKRIYDGGQRWSGMYQEWITIDATRDIDTVAQDVLRISLDAISRISGSEPFRIS